MATLTARAWKAFYAGERATLGSAGLARLLDEGEPLARAGACPIFPHTRLAASGALVAAAALSIVRSGADEVLAIGVLHGAREQDANLVKRARAGDPSARAALRRVHGPGAPHDAGHAGEEFSLDGFLALIEVAARREGRKAPRVLARYPFLAGPDPETMPGFEELAGAIERGAAIVATADMIHHGAGYDTKAEARLDREGPEAAVFARRTVAELVSLLTAGDFDAHERRATEVRSDFRDAGPMFATLIRARGASMPSLAEIRLVDYADVLRADPPTWVAAALFV